MADKTKGIASMADASTAGYMATGKGYKKPSVSKDGEITGVDHDAKEMWSRITKGSGPKPR